MISRYTRPEMAALWSEETKYSIWFDVELLALEGMEAIYIAPKGTAQVIRERARVNPSRIADIEREVKHDVIAFLTSISEQAGAPARFLHRGMTSSDLLDTALAVQLSRAGKTIEQELDRLIDTLSRRAEEFKRVVCIGRSHGIHAEPTTFGLKLLSFSCELVRRRDEFRRAIHQISVGKIAGAVGTYASVDPRVEVYVLSRLGLQAETVPSQVVHRDRHASYFSSLALIGASSERIATEIRHLQRTEVGEVEEGFSKGQKGSSAMPHKKNPINSENVTGLARMLRGYLIPSIESVALWHERDISHSSVERMIAPDATSLAHFMLFRLVEVVEQLVVHPDKMTENLARTRGVIFSGALLLALTDGGMSRDDAYQIVQQLAHSTLGGGQDFQERVMNNPQIAVHLSIAHLKELFSMERYVKHTDYLFERAKSAIVPA